MAYLPLRSVGLPQASERVFDAWLEQLEDRSPRPGADWNRLTRDILFEIWYPGLTDYDALVEDPATPLGTRAALLSLDPRNITLEPEYYADVDAERYARVKPLHWLWQSFDRSPLGAGNVHLGVRLPPSAGAAPLRPLRPQLQVLPVRRVLLRLQPGGGRRLRRAPPRAARRPRRHRARQSRQHLRLREHLQPHAQHRGPEGGDQRPDRARGRRAHHVPRDRPGRRPGRPERDGRRDGGGDQERPPVST